MPGVPRGSPRARDRRSPTASRPSSVGQHARLASGAGPVRRLPAPLCRGRRPSPGPSPGARRCSPRDPARRRSGSAPPTRTAGAASRSPSSTPASSPTPTWSSPRTGSCGTWTSPTPGARRADLEQPGESSWHGMMTSVVACGNGRLSGGLYRGLASEARLVLVKCGSVRRITPRRHPPRPRVGDPQPQALRHPRRQRELRRRLRGLVPGGRPLPGGGARHARGPPRLRRRRATWATCRATRCCRRLRRRRC